MGTFSTFNTFVYLFLWEEIKNKTGPSPFYIARRPYFYGFERDRTQKNPHFKG